MISPSGKLLARWKIKEVSMGKLEPAKARITPAFLHRLEETGMTDMAIAASFGMTRQEFSAIKLGKQPPTVRFLAGAVRSGLAESFADVAEYAPTPEEKAIA